MSGGPGSEDAAVEEPALELLADLGWQVLSGSKSRRSWGDRGKADVVLEARCAMQFNG